MSAKGLSRRQFLRGLTVTAMGAVLAACAQPTPTPPPKPEPTKAVATALPPTAAPTKAPATAAPTAAADRWASYPPGHPRKWVGPIVPAGTKNSPPVTITSAFALQPDQAYRSGESVEDNVVSRWLMNELGIAFKLGFTVPSGDKTVWPAHMASGDLPELMFSGSLFTYFDDLLAAGKLEDLTDVYESLVDADNRKKQNYPDHPMWVVATRKKRVYAFPNNTGSLAQHEHMLWVRQDWLNKVNLPVPQTIDQVAEVARAFVKAGLATVGLALGGTTLNQWLASAFPVFGAFGVMPDRWVKDGKGGLVHGATLPGNKDALAFLQKMYKDGLIEPDFVSKDAVKAGEVMVAGKAGIWFAPSWSVNYPLRPAIEKDRTIKWVAARVPTGPGGLRGRPAMAFARAGGTAFLKGTPRAKIEAVIRYQLWYDAMSETCEVFLQDQNQPYEIEGYDYVLEGDTVKQGQYRTGYYVPFKGYGLWPRLLWKQTLAAAHNKLRQANPKDLNPLQRWVASDPIAADIDKAYLLQLQFKEDAVENQFYGAPTPTMLKSQANLDKMVDQTQMKIVTGQSPVGDYDKMVADWKAQGGDKITEEVNAWLKSL